MCATSSTVTDSRRAAPPDSSAIMARSKATAAKVFPDCCVCNCPWPGRDLTANALNSGALDDTTPLYQLKAGAPHLRAARVTGVKTKRPLFLEQPLLFLKR